MSLMQIIAADAAEETANMRYALELARAARNSGDLKEERRADVREEMIRGNPAIDPQAITIAIDEVSRES
jgi:hypothetical protein